MILRQDRKHGVTEGLKSSVLQDVLGPGERLQIRTLDRRVAESLRQGVIGSLGLAAGSHPMVDSEVLNRGVFLRAGGRRDVENSTLSCSGIALPAHRGLCLQAEEIARGWGAARARALLPVVAVRVIGAPFPDLGRDQGLVLPEATISRLSMLNQLQ